MIQNDTLRLCIAKHVERSTSWVMDFLQNSTPQLWSFHIPLALCAFVPLVILVWHDFASIASIVYFNYSHDVLYCLAVSSKLLSSKQRLMCTHQGSNYLLQSGTMTCHAWVIPSLLHASDSLTLQIWVLLVTKLDSTMNLEDSKWR